MDDIKYMRRALELAKMAEGDTSPNPMVGAVITDSSGKIVAKAIIIKPASHMLK